jgi:hypothetical protein
MGQQQRRACDLTQILPQSHNSCHLCPTAGSSKSQCRYVQITIFVAHPLHRLPLRARAASAHRELAPGFAWAAEPGPWAGVPGGACPYRRTNPFPAARRGEKPLVSERAAQFQEFRAEFRELLYDWAWSRPVVSLGIKKASSIPRFQGSRQNGRRAYYCVCVNGH